MVAGDRDAGGGGVDASLAVRWDQLSAAGFPTAAAIADAAMENQREQVCERIILSLRFFHVILFSHLILYEK